MSFYTQKLKPIIAELIREGEYTLDEIAKMCRVSLTLVVGVKREIEKYI